MCGRRDPRILKLGGEQSTSPLLQGTEPLVLIGQECELTPQSVWTESCGKYTNCFFLPGIGF
jgi:hypothetical protein